MRQDDPWRALRRFTPARIALGRSGESLPTDEVLAFALAHARARDAVHAPLETERMTAALAAIGLAVTPVESAASDRPTYLTRPDLGRRLSVASQTLVAADRPDLALVVADGLSAAAVHAHAALFLAALAPKLAARRLTVSPAYLARNGRVALGDEVGGLAGARAVAVIIGERPGLSSPDSLGVYLTFAPRPGRTDAERNCISNIRPEGLSYETAAFKLDWLLAQAFRRSLTGVELKDESDLAQVGTTSPGPRLA